MDDDAASLRSCAIEQLAIYLAWIIRHRIGDDPDHSGPEDVADKVAELMIDNAEAQVVGGDWRSLMEE